MITANRDLRQKMVGCSIFRAIANGERVFVSFPFRFRFRSLSRSRSRFNSQFAFSFALISK